MRFLTDRRLTLWLWVLLGLFGIRVMAQWLQSRFSFAFLPAFDDWHSGALPYPTLLSLQALIAAVMAYTCWVFTRASPVPRRGAGVALLVFGGVYLVTMLGRLVIGLFFMPDHYWFGQHLPSLFHLVLASFVLLVGGYHFSCSDRPRQ